MKGLFFPICVLFLNFLFIKNIEFLVIYENSIVSFEIFGFLVKNKNKILLFFGMK